MKVAVLFSGGKDSTYALYECLKRNWEVCLISVKPKKDDSYLWHFATVEWTLLSSIALNLPLYLIKCEKVGINEEVKELERILKELKIDGIVLGGTGLQKSQIKAIRRVAKKYGLRVILPHKGKSHYKIFKQMIKDGFKIMITQVSTNGLGPEWLGKVLSLEDLEILKNLSKKFGFHIGFEGGVAETFVLDGPIFSKRIEFTEYSKVWDSSTYSGYLEVREAKIFKK